MRTIKLWCFMPEPDSFAVKNTKMPVHSSFKLTILNKNMLSKQEFALDTVIQCM